MKQEDIQKRDNNGKFAKGGVRPPNAGRKKGSKNKTSILAADRAAQMGVDPFELLLLFASNKYKELGYSKEIPMDIRFNAIKEACTYILPKKRSIEVMQEEKECLPERSFLMPDPRELK